MSSPSDQIWIPDSSPLFFYSPAEAYFENMNLVSWTGHNGSASVSGVSASSTGGGGAEVLGGGGTSSYHSVSGSGGVALPSIYSLSFTPIFSAPETYSLQFQRSSLDPEDDWKSGQSWNETTTDFHSQTFTLYTACKAGEGACGADAEGVKFSGAWVGTKFAPDGAEAESATLDDAAPEITYSGFSPVDKDNKIVAVTDDDHEGTLSMTDTKGAKAEVRFTGGSIIVRGVTCPSCGVYTVTLDGSTPSATLKGFNNATVHNTILFFATNLDTSVEHTLTLEAQEGGVVLDQIEARGPKGGVGFGGKTNGTSASGSSPSSTGTGSGDQSLSGTSGGSPNAGVIVGAVLGSLAGIAFLWWLCRRVAPKAKKPDEKKMNPWDEANLLQNMKNEEVHVTTAANQRYVYPGLIAHSDLKKK